MLYTISPVECSCSVVFKTNVQILHIKKTDDTSLSVQQNFLHEFRWIVAIFFWINLNKNFEIAK